MPAMKVCGAKNCSELTRTAYCKEHSPIRPHGWGSSKHQHPPGWERLRLRTLRRDKWRCVMCGGKASEVDHLLPMAWGGSPKDPTNLRSLCRQCHQQKTKDERRLGKVLKTLDATQRKYEVERFLAKWRGT